MSMDVFKVFRHIECDGVYDATCAVVFKFKFDVRGEYDMVIYDKNTNTCRIYEVKHSEKIVEQQTRFLRMKELNEITEKRFGKIAGKYVIYRGKTQEVDGIQYVNVEEYLNSLASWKKYNSTNKNKTNS